MSWWWADALGPAAQRTVENAYFTPTTIGVPSSVLTPAVTAGASITAGNVAGTASVPTPAISTGGSVLVTPSSVVGTANVPQPTVSPAEALPTLIEIDSFVHGSFKIAQAETGLTGTYDAMNASGGTFTKDTGIVRTSDHVCSCRIDKNATFACYIGRNFPAGLQDINGSFYIRMTAPPSTSPIGVLHIQTAASVGGLLYVTTGGELRARAGTNNPAGGTVVLANIADGNWHRVDFRLVTSAATFTWDGQIDGTPWTQQTYAGTAADIANYRMGSTTPGGTGTVWFSDVAMSATASDYPIGEHVCLALDPTGYSDGTHNLGGVISTQSGGTTNLNDSVDDVWLPDADTTYLRQTAAGTGNYAEINCGSAVIGIVWGMQCIIGAAPTTSTTANLAGHKLTDGTNTDTIADGTAALDYSYTAPGVVATYRAVRSASWLPTALQDGTLKFRWGFSNNATVNPRLSGFLIEYAGIVGAAPSNLVISNAVHVQAAENVDLSTGAGSTLTVQDATHAHVTEDGYSDIYSNWYGLTLSQGNLLLINDAVHGHTADNVTFPVVSVNLTLPTFGAVASVPTPSVAAGPTVTSVTPDTVVGTSGVPTPTVDTTVAATPTTVAGTSTVPTPTVTTGGALPIPDTVTRTATVPTPIVATKVSITPTTVARTASVFAPTFPVSIDWEFTYNGLTFGGSREIGILDVTGLGPPATKADIRQKVAKDGAFVLASYYEERHIIIDGDIVPTSGEAADLEALVNAWRVAFDDQLVDSNLDYRLPNAPTRRIKCKPIRRVLTVDREYSTGRATWSVELLAADPAIYDTNNTKVFDG